MAPDSTTKSVKARTVRPSSAKARAAISDAELHDLVRLSVFRMLPILPPDLAEALWRADLFGDSMTTIAHALGISPAVVAILLRQAREAVGQLLHTQAMINSTRAGSKSVGQAEERLIVTLFGDDEC